jgi:hypothetical protein
MTSSKLKALLEMIVRKTFAEIHDSHTLDGSNLVTIEGIQLPDGRKIGANVVLEGHSDDGGFGYEHGNAKGTHRYAAQFELDTWSIERVWDQATNAEIPLTTDIAKIINAEMGSIADEVTDKINDNPD